MDDIMNHYNMMLLSQEVWFKFISPVSGYLIESLGTNFVDGTNLGARLPPYIPLQEYGRRFRLRLMNEVGYYFQHEGHPNP